MFEAPPKAAAGGTKRDRCPQYTRSRWVWVDRGSSAVGHFLPFQTNMVSKLVVIAQRGFLARGHAAVEEMRTSLARCGQGGERRPARPTEVVF